MKGLALLLAVALAAFSAGASLAESAPSRQEVIKKEKRLEDVRKKLRDEQKAIREISGKETDILGEMEEINKGLSEKREELRVINESLSGMKRDLSRTESNLKRLSAEKERLSRRLAGRLKAMYKMRRGEAMEVLFSSDASTLGRRHKYLTVIMELDSGLIRDYEANMASLDSEKRKKEELVSGLAASRREAAQKEAEAGRLHRAKLELLAEVKGEKARREKVVKELERAAEELSRLIEKLRADEGAPELPAGTGFAAAKGRLPMPVEGRVVSQYGKVVHPKFQTVTFNNGITIEAALGAPVRSVYGGRVIYAGWLKGYGQVLIIDHKGGFYTLFAHLGKSLKDKGEEVPAGTEVGYVGDSGPEGRPGLYFEIRQKGVPRDPMAWLASR